MSELLYRVKSQLHVRANRKVVHLLDGEYSSFTRGRSMEFDDLRSYVAGDEVKDIDWKATARHTTPLVKQYLASRRQRLVFLTNTGKNMAALSESGASKRNLLLLSVGVLAYLATQHGDEVSMLYGHGKQIAQVPRGTTERTIERMLDRLEAASQLKVEEHDFIELLDYAFRTIKQRSILIIVTDELPITDALDLLIRRLHSKHEVLWLTLSDASPLSVNSAFDIDDEIFFPDFLRTDKKLSELFQQRLIRGRDERERFMKRLGISHQFLSSETETIPTLLRMLRRRMFAGV